MNSAKEKDDSSGSNGAGSASPDSKKSPTSSDHPNALGYSSRSASLTELPVGSEDTAVMKPPSTPSGSYMRRSYRRLHAAGTSTKPSLSASMHTTTPTSSGRRHSMNSSGSAHSTPGGGGQTYHMTPGSRRKLSEKLADKVSVFETGTNIIPTGSLRTSLTRSSSLLSLEPPPKGMATIQSPDHEKLSPNMEDNKDNDTIPEFASPSTSPSARGGSGHKKRNSKATELIHQFNEKAALYQSPGKKSLSQTYHDSGSGGGASPDKQLLSPKQVKELVKMSGGSNHLKAYKDITPTRKSLKRKVKALPFLEYEDEDDDDDDVDLEDDDEEFGSERRKRDPLLSPHEVKALIKANTKSQLFQQLVNAYEDFSHGNQIVNSHHESMNKGAEEAAEELLSSQEQQRQVRRKWNAQNLAKSRQRQYKQQQKIEEQHEQEQEQEQQQQQQQKRDNDNDMTIATTSSTTETRQNKQQESIVTTRERLPPSPPNTASRLHAAATTEAAAGTSLSNYTTDVVGDLTSHHATAPVHKSIRNYPLDMETFQPAQFPNKTSEDEALIEATVEDNFVFAEFRPQGKARLDDNALGALVDAFEPMEATPGQEIKATGNAKTDDKNENEDEEYFYIVQKGQVDIHIDGKMIGTAVKGDYFGEQALLHPTMVAATQTQLIAGSDNTEVATLDGGKTRLLRLDHKSFRGILQTQVMQATEIKKELIQSIDFLQPLFAEDDRLLNPLAKLLQRQEFVEGDEFVVNEASNFVMVHSGRLLIRSNDDSTILSTLESGEYFGERGLMGLLSNESNVGDVTLKGTKSNEMGVFFSMDRIAMERALGEHCLQQLQDWASFNQTTSMQGLFNRGKTKKNRRGMVGSTSPSKTRGLLADRIRRKRFKEGQGQNILKDEVPEEPAVYVVREGMAHITYTDSKGTAHEKMVGKGEVFGNEYWEDGDDGWNSERPADYSAKTAGGGPVSVGVLSIKDVVEAELDAGNPQKEEKIVPTIDPSQVAVVSTAALRLQQKIRDAVQLNIRLEDLEKISVLGEGQYGEVWLVAADAFQTGVDSLKQRFALKSQYTTDDTRGDEALEAIRREIDILESLTEKSPHPGIVNMVQTYEDQECIYMLMGLIPGGELWNRIHQEGSDGNWSSGMDEAAAKFYTYVVADTLGFMHAQQILFRDLKPENIMLDEDGYPVLVDFGFAKRLPDGEKTFTFCGTPNYVAPEIILHSGHDKGVDYWALGVTMYEMVAGENPFYYDGLDQITLYDVICHEAFYAYPTKPSPAMLDITHLLLQKESHQRLGCLAGGYHDILNHAWFNDCGWTLSSIRSKQVKAPWKPHNEGNGGEIGGDGSENPEEDDEAMEELLASFAAAPPFTEEEPVAVGANRNPRSFLMTPNLSSTSSLGIAENDKDEEMHDLEEDFLDDDDDDDDDVSLHDVIEHPMEEEEISDSDDVEILDQEEDVAAKQEAGDDKGEVRRSSLLSSSGRRNQPRLSRRAKERVKNERRSTIKGALKDLGLGDSSDDLNLDDL